LGAPTINFLLILSKKVYSYRVGCRIEKSKCGFAVTMGSTSLKDILLSPTELVKSDFRQANPYRELGVKRKWSNKKSCLSEWIYY
jgi:hypothetical protein